VLHWNVFIKYHLLVLVSLIYLVGVLAGFAKKCVVRLVPPFSMNRLPFFLFKGYSLPLISNSMCF